MSIVEAISKFNNSPKAKVIKSILALVLSLVLVTAVAFAWFASNGNAGSGGMQIKVLSENSFGNYTAYYIHDIDTKEVQIGAQTSTESGMGVLDITLRAYDMTFTSVNQYAPIVIRMELYSVATENIPAGNATKTLTVKVARNPALDTETTSQKLGGVISSVGQIGCYTSSSTALNADADDIYGEIITLYRADNSPYKFTTKTNNTYSKVSELNINLTYRASDFKTNNAGDSCLVAYMVIDYNPTFVADYIDVKSQEETEVNAFDRGYEITNDLSTIDISFA